jgi:DNA-directed RNA polymerase specialized sigma24 family protein
MDANRRDGRKKKIGVLHGGDMDIFPNLNADDGLYTTIRTEIRKYIQLAVEELPEGMRISFELFYRQDYSGSEAAAVLDISEEAFFMRLSTARNRLRQKLKTMGVTI